MELAAQAGRRAVIIIGEDRADRSIQGDGKRACGRLVALALTR